MLSAGLYSAVYPAVCPAVCPGGVEGRRGIGVKANFSFFPGRFARNRERSVCSRKSGRDFRESASQKQNRRVLPLTRPFAGFPRKKGMEESIYEETSNSAAFEFSRLRSSSLSLFIEYWNILAQIWRCRSDLVDFSVFFQRFSVFRFPAPQRSLPRFRTQKQGAPCRRRTLPLKFSQHL